ncbi:hypothetical protein ACHAXN_010487 [Cyclotella atomus]
MAAAAVPATFTTSFLTTIQTQKSSLTSWLSSEKSRIDVLTSDIEHAHSDETERIVAQLQRLDDVRTQRGLVAASNSENDAAVMGGVARQKRDLEEKKCSLEARVEAMRGKNTQGDMVLNELLKQQAEHQEQAIASRNKKLAIAEMKNTTIDDLTKGLINYKYTGLSFERVGKKGDLLFKFTRLSAVEPNKVFSFILTNQTDGTYILSKCEPELNKDKTDVLVQVLNSDSDNGLMHFMAGMSECIYD